MHSDVRTTNLSDAMLTRRLRFGILGGTITMAMAFVVLEFDLPSAARLAMFVPFAAAAYGVTQAMCKT